MGNRTSRNSSGQDSQRSSSLSAVKSSTIEQHTPGKPKVRTTGLSKSKVGENPLSQTTDKSSKEKDDLVINIYL